MSKKFLITPLDTMFFNFNLFLNFFNLLNFLDCTNFLLVQQKSTFHNFCSKQLFCKFLEKHLCGILLHPVFFFPRIQIGEEGCFPLHENISFCRNSVRALFIYSKRLGIF